MIFIFTDLQNLEVVDKQKVVLVQSFLSEVKMEEK